MIKVFQVLKKVEIYEKPRYSPEIRGAFWDWDQTVFTSGIEIKDKVLLVPGKAGHDIKHGGFLTFIESVAPSGKDHDLADQALTSAGFENLKFKPEQERVHVYTSFSEWRFSEVPLAENHKIAELMPGDTLRFMANDRYDFSATARKQRSYILYDYLIHYKGLVRRIEFTGKEERKLFTPTSWKEVDERKIIK